MPEAIVVTATIRVMASIDTNHNHGDKALVDGGVRVGAKSPKAMMIMIVRVAVVAVAPRVVRIHDTRSVIKARVKDHLYDGLVIRKRVKLTVRAVGVKVRVLVLAQEVKADKIVSVGTTVGMIATAIATDTVLLAKARLCIHERVIVQEGPSLRIDISIIVGNAVANICIIIPVALELAADDMCDLVADVTARVIDSDLC